MFVLDKQFPNEAFANRRYGRVLGKEDLVLEDVFKRLPPGAALKWSGSVLKKVLVANNERPAESLYKK
jgi:hypothetical protein